VLSTLSRSTLVCSSETTSSTDQTLPIWIFQNLFRPNQAPIVNAVAAFLVLVSIVPIYLANRLSGGAALTQR
jgi:putative spermidine/putrescine transport system permease protein